MDKRFAEVESVVFDVGNVLLRFDPTRVAGLLPDENRRPLMEAMFGPRHLWAAFDLGLESNEEIARRISSAAGLADDWPWVVHVLSHFHEVMVPLPLAGELPALRAQGKRLFALTNYPEPSFSLACAAFPFLTRDLEGAVVSAREKLVKPDPAIFRLLTRRYSLTPEKTLFIDDLEANVRSAASLGFRTWHYTEENQVR